VSRYTRGMFCITRPAPRVFAIAAVTFCVLLTPAQALPRGTLPFHDCVLRHPYRLQSFAARCTELRVPEDRATPAGAQIALQVAVLPALNRRVHTVPLVLLAGGPGQAASDLYTSSAAAFARVQREHDIVLLDQRGTGGSSRLDCNFPQDWDEDASTLPALRDATQSCLAALGPRVRHYTTSVAIEDLEQLRIALGEPKIALYGGSYGSRTAELYIRRHADRVEAAILDGVVDPQAAIGPDLPRYGEAALRKIIERCGRDADCQRAFPNLAAELAQLRTRFGTESERITVADPTTGLPRQLVFNRAVFVASLRFLSYNSMQASLLPLSIHEAARGHLAMLAAQALMNAARIGDAIAIGMHNSVVCAEDVPYYSPQTLADPSVGANYQGSDQLRGLIEICKIWPRGPVDTDLHAPLAANVPTLLLSGDSDPVTPPESAERAARGLQLHRHIVLAGEGHGLLGIGCMPDLLEIFLARPDPKKLDTSCLSKNQPVPFLLSTAGPAP
jgi:pimeloyl-ACP methyl ester carboxylesterase